MKTFIIKRDIEKLKFFLDNEIDDNKKYVVTVKQHRGKRTIKQNSLLHLWLACIAQETGNTMEDVKTAYKAKLMRKKWIKIGAREIEVARSTTELNTKQMAHFMNLIEVDAATMGIKLLRPDELGWDSFQETYRDYIG